MSSTTGSKRGRRLAALFAAALLALSGGALTACGDDKEGPAEDVGKAIDKGGKKLGKEAKEAERELDDGKKD